MRLFFSLVAAALLASPFLQAAPVPCHVVDSGQPGPTVIITGAIAGGGPAAAYAAEEMRQWRLAKGRLLIVPATSEAEELAGRLAPASKQDLDSPELKEALRLSLDDIVTGSKSEAPATSRLGVSVDEAQKNMAQHVLAKINAALPADATLCELQPHEEKPRAGGPHLTFTTAAPKLTLAVRARQHRLCAHALLLELGMLDPSTTPETIIDPKAAIRVAVFDGAGSAGLGVPNVLAQLRTHPGTAVVRVCAEDIAAGALTQFTVAMFTGGSGSKQAGTLGDVGRENVNRFVRGGGGYVGICAGSYLACKGFSWGLGILNAKTASPKWQRGRGLVKIELSNDGRSLLGDYPGQIDCRYGNGPILVPAQAEDLPAFETLAHFRTEFAENNTPVGLMLNSPAIVRSTCGQGRVLCISPHPEQTPGLEGVIPRAVDWVTSPGKAK